MYKIEKLNPENIDIIKDLYNEFVKKSASDYEFELEPLDFEIFKESVLSGYIQGFVYSEEKPLGFLAFTDFLNESVELNLIHFTKTSDLNEKKVLLLKEFVEYVKEHSEKRTICYPMAGIQADFVEDIAYNNFKLVGQAIVEFTFDNPISQIILERCNVKKVEPPYSIDVWRDEYFENATIAVQERFHNLSDAKFDPRFETIEGAKDIIKKITDNEYGVFLKNETSVLKYNDEAVGFCFANLTVPQHANIPIIAIKRPHHHLGFGQALLKNTVQKLKQLKEISHPELFLVNATCDTDNFPAVRTYRKIGFKEKTFYPQAYLKL